MLKDKINSLKNLFLLKKIMKQILGIIGLLLIINACDDGNLKADTIDFSTIAIQKCTNKDILYKVKDAQMLLLAIPDATFSADETPENTPIEVPINATNQVLFRQYDAAASANNICPTITAASPNLVEEWTAVSGIIQITSTAIKTTNTTTNATRITGYKYYIVFKNITFQKPNGTQVYESFVFGNYTKSFSPLAFNFDDQVEKSSCVNDNRIFNFSGSESLILDVTDFSTLFENAVTTSPRTALIDANHKFTYRLYTGTITNTYFCTLPIPSTPTISQQWSASDGVAGISGIIEVSTTTLANGFQHTIHIKKAVLKQGNSTFDLGDDYLFGSFVTYP
jgi:hypothetical protein